MDKFCILIVTQSLLITLSHVYATNLTANERLAEALFKTYNAKLRPIKSARAMKVFLDMNLYQILEIFFSIEMDQMSTERYMTTVLHPDTTSSKHGIKRTWIKMAFPAIYKVACFMNIKYFPWDTQTCPMEFTSWTFDKTELDYSSAQDSVNLKYYRQNQEYDLVDFPVTETVLCENITQPYIGNSSVCFSYVNFTLIIQQKPLFYIFNLIIPSFVLSIICFMGLFTLSSSTGERTEKISLGITTILALSIIMLVISDQIPKTSIDIPIIGWYFLIQMLLIGSGLVATVFMVHLHKNGVDGKPIPLWLLKLTKIFVFPEMVSNLTNTEETMDTFALEEQNVSSSSVVQVSQKPTKAEHHDETFNEIKKHLQRVASMIQDTNELLQSTHEDKAHLQNWETVIKLMEKILFISFSLAAFLSTGLFLLVGFTCT